MARWAQHPAAAVRYAREAYAAEPSTLNRTTLLAALAHGEAPERTAAERAEMTELATDQLGQPDLEPDDFVVLCQAAVAAGNLPLLKRCVTSYKAKASDAWPAEYAQWIVDTTEHRFDDAVATLGRARALGMPQADYESLLHDTQNRSKSPLRAVLRIGAWILGIWLLGFGALIAAGSALSRAALRSAASLPATRTGAAVGLAKAVRGTYAAVLTASCAFYYASIPIVILLALAVVAALFYGFVAIGRIPLKLAALVLFVLGVTVWTSLRSLLVRGRDHDPGERLDLGAHPRLRDVLHEVADRVGTRVVDNVYLTPGTDFAVMERGGLMRQLRKRTERCLILGIGGLEGMPLAPFKAVLAHEYGHFSNRDTAGGGLALAVRRSLVALALGLARGGAAGWYNPVWLFVNGFYRVFLRISQGASRLQEVLADRWAATLYGAEAFQQGLRHVIERTIRFGLHAEAVIDEVIEQSLPLHNLYRCRPTRVLDNETAGRRIAEALKAKASPYDSHPSPADRFAWVAALGAGSASVIPEASTPVWDLFSEREAIELRMTALVRATIEARHGLTIPAAL